MGGIYNVNSTPPDNAQTRWARALESDDAVTSTIPLPDDPQHKGVVTLCGLAWGTDDVGLEAVDRPRIIGEPQWIEPGVRADACVREDRRELVVDDLPPRSPE